ncbi:hypothetical protein AAVH_24107 [Aphelenchoides avenae]|nr:hypothetical protein AAVH_24107 [Aphelenchus avenae]
MTSEQAYKDALIADLEQSRKLVHDIDVSKCVISAILPLEDQLAQADARIEQIDAFVSKINSLANEIAYHSDSYAAWAETVLDPDEREAVNHRYLSLTDQKLDHLATMNERSKKIRKEKASYQKLITSLTDRLQPQQAVEAQVDQKPVPTSNEAEGAGAPPQGVNHRINDGQQPVAQRSDSLHPPPWSGGQYNR